MKNGARDGDAALKHNERHAIVALAADPQLPAALRECRWLARGRWHRAERADLLPRILGVLSLPLPEGGLAALRFRGWSGESPPGWMAAADPVYLETRMSHLRLRVFPDSELPPGEVRDVFELLQERLGEPQARTFTCAGATGYLELATPIATSPVSPAVADGASPEFFLPQGAEAADHDRWHSEVQMCLHDAEVNQRRMSAGRLPVNSLWFWGGGVAPEPVRRALPVLFAADDVVRGYWLSSGARAEAWPGSLGACAAAAGGSFVAVAPGTPGPVSLLAELRELLARGTIRRLTLLLPGGTLAEIRRGDRFRFWRRSAGLADDGGEG